MFLGPCVMPDLLDRCVVACTMAAQENPDRVKQLLAEAIARYGIEPGHRCPRNAQLRQIRSPAKCTAY